MSTPQHAPAEAFFLAETRFCLYHAPQGTCRGALVYLHPFADEMNKSRRMAALQARALAAQGYGVLQIDLHGCGDSDGEFADARWEQWKDDVAAASAWLRERLQMPVGLWGLRLGALLALDCARTQAVAQLLLWQPVLQGALFTTQFLRLRVAGGMLGDAPSESTAQLRAALHDGQTLEVAGYMLAPQLIDAIEDVEAIHILPTCPVNWIEIVASSERPVTPAALRVAAEWTRLGAPPALHKVAAQPFWATQEIAESSELLAATCALFEGSAP